MKRGTPRHPKVIDLCEALDRRRPEVLGFLELLWHFASEYAPQGDIGRYSDARIEAACDWNGRRGALIEALRKTSWVDEHKQYRLLVHDWHDHADESVKKRLSRLKLDFLTDQSDTEKVTGKCLDGVETKSAIEADGVATRARALPSPVPVPSPMPLPVPVPDTDTHAPTAPLETPPLPHDLSGLVAYLKTNHPKNRTCHDERRIVEALMPHFAGAIHPDALERDIRQNHRDYLARDPDVARGIVFSLIRWIKERALVATDSSPQAIAIRSPAATPETFHERNERIRNEKFAARILQDIEDQRRAANQSK